MRPVRRQLGALGQAVEHGAPVLQLLGDERAEVLALPERVVGVLHRQRLPPRRRAVPPRSIGGRKVPPQRRHRPAVGRDVVHDQHQDVLVLGAGARSACAPLGQAQQLRVHRYLGGQVERVPRRGRHVRRQCGLGRRRDRQLDRRVVQHELVRRAVVVREHGAQRLVPVDDVGERGAQGLDVQLAGQAHRHRHVVGRRRALEPVQEPEPLLSERQRHPVRPGLGAFERRPGGGAVRRRRVEQRRQCGRRRRAEHRADVDLDTGNGPDARHQLRGEQRVPAEVEEPVLGTDRDAQYAGEQLTEQLLGGRLRAAPGAALRTWVRQGRRVHLAAGQQREPLQHDDVGGHHVLGQPLGDVRAQARGQRGDLALGSRVVGISRRRSRRRGVRPGAVGAGHRGLTGRTEHGVQVAGVRAGHPAQRERASELLGQLVQPLGVGRARLLGQRRAGVRRRRTPSLDETGRGHLARQPCVGHIGDPDPSRVLLQRSDERLLAVPPAHGLRRGRLGGPGVQHDVVAVPGQLVVPVPALDADLDVREAGQRPEEIRVEHELAVPGHRCVHVGGQRRGIVTVPAQDLDGRPQQPLRAPVADVTQEQAASGGEQRPGVHDHVDQIGGAREVLRHRVDDHRVQIGRADPVQLVRGPGRQAHPARQVRGVRRQPGLQVRDRLRGQVHAPEALGRRGDPGQDQPGPDADLQHPPGGQRLDPRDRRRVPLAHVLERDVGAVVAGLPPAEVLLPAGVPDLGEHGLVQVLPGLDLLVLGALVALGARHDVGDDPVVAHRGQCGGHLLVARDHVLDLAELDAVAADLHLVVRAPVEHQAPVRGPAHEVTGPVQALARRERVGDEPLGGPGGPAQVAAGQAGAPEVELAQYTGRDRGQRGVQHVHPGARVRDADRDLRRTGQLAGLGGAERGVHRGLGGAVRVEQPPAGCPALDQLRRDPLGAGQQHGVGRQLALRRERLQQRGRQDHERDPVRARVLGQRRARHPPVRGHDHQAAAGEEGQAQVEERHVEAGRGELQDPRGGLVAEPLPLGLDEPEHAGVGHHDALRRPGRARRVDDVGGAVRGLRPRDRTGVRDRLELVDQDARCVADVERVVAGQHTDRRRVGEHERDPGRGQCRVDRQVRGTCLEHAELRDDGVQRPGQRERHHRVLHGTVPGEQPRDLVRARVQLGVGHRGVLEHERGRPRVARDDGGEQVAERRRTDRVPGAAPVGQHRLPLAAGEQVDSADPQLRIRDDGGHHAAQPLQDPVDGDAVEHLGVVLDDPVDPVRPLGQRHGEVELRRAGRDEHRIDGQSREHDVGDPVVLSRQHHLEQRVVRERPGGIELLHQPLERQVLVTVRVQVPLPDLVEQRAERRVAGRVHAQHERVHEEPDQVVQRGVGAAGDRAADRHVLPGADPREQRRERGVHDHEHGGVLLPGERGQPAMQLGVPAEREQLPREPGDRRVRTVGGQVDPGR